MKRLRLSVVSLLVANALPCWAEPVQTLPLKAKRWAVVIGVDDYQDKQIGHLEGAAKDAKALSETLIQSANFPSDQVIVLATGEPDSRRPTRINILTTVKSVAKKAQGGLLVIAFSGHGVERDQEPYLLPEDAHIFDDVELLAEATVRPSWIREQLQTSGVSQVLLFLDACRSDPGGRSVVASRMSDAYLRALQFDNQKIDASAIVYAAALGERAYEYDEKKQGYFTWAVVDGLRGAAANERGEITLGGLIDHVKKTVAKQVAITGRDQHPDWKNEGFDDQLIVAMGTPKTLAVPRIGQGANAGDAEVSDSRPMMEMKFWDTVEKMNTIEAYLEYEKTFPRGMFVGLSKIKREKLADTRSAVRDEAEKAYLAGDYVTARGILQTASIDGDPEAQARLGSLDFLCIGVHCNMPEAVRTLERAAQQGSRTAEGWLATAWVTRGAAREHGLEYAKKSSERNDLLGMAALADAYDRGIGMTRDVQAARELYRRILPQIREKAEQGDPWWQNWLGFEYDHSGGGLIKDENAAVKWYEKAAAHRYAPAQNNLGVEYLHGRGGLPKNEQKGLELIRASAEQGYGLGELNLGEAYEHGRYGLSADPLHALELYKQAADQGVPFAQATLATVYQEGRCGLAKDGAKAVDLYRQASAQGDIFALSRLGSMYEFGDGGLEKDTAKALDFFTQAADRGNSWAQNRLAGWYEKGLHGVQKDPLKAVALYRDAANDGIAEAQSHLADFYANGAAGLDRDDAKAVELYQAAAANDDANGQFGLGNMYADGRGGLTEDKAKAVELFQKASNQNFAPALVALAYYYASGEGSLPKNGAKAVELFKKAADLNDASAQNSLGFRYAYGVDGLIKDDSKAVELYKKAAEQEYPPAENNLGVMYAAGRGGLAVDEVKAAELYASAADKGDTAAQNNLGKMFEEGRGGLPKDIDKALQLYRKAAERGNERAKANVARLTTSGP